MFHHHFKFKRKEENDNGKNKLISWPKLIMFLLLATVLSLLGFRLYFMFDLATKGQELANLETEVKKLEETNSFLKYELSKLVSLSEIEKRARELGYKPAASVIFLTGERPLAKLGDNSSTP